MPTGPQPLEETLLIGWLKKNYKEIEFIDKKLDYEAHDRTKKLVEAIQNLDENKNLFDQKSAAVDVWRSLIGKAIVYLKYKDDREKYHDDEDYGVERLEEFIVAFSQFEPLLYGAEEGYRDHMCHMLSVFLVGDYLIRTMLGGFGEIRVSDIEVIESQVSPNEKEAMWCIISLAHDLGIALEKIPNINPKVEGMLKKFGSVDMQRLSYPFVRLPMDDFTVNFVSSDLRELPSTGKEREFITHVQSKYLLKFSEAYERRDHGIVSCLVLMKNLVFFLETDYTVDTRKPLDLEDAKQFLVRRNILRAIASHSNDNIYYLKVIEFPFILRICDELHERERPRLIEMFEGEKINRVVTVEDFSHATIHYKVTFELRTGIELEGDKKEELRDEVRAYFNGKCERIRRILRSALGGEDRQLSLTLEVVDNLEIPPSVYKLIHKTPEDIKITIDDKDISWLGLVEQLRKA